MVTTRSARDGQSRRAALATGILALLAAIVLVSGCATHGAPAKVAASAEDRRAACDDFAHGEVRRLGESVPVALTKGFLAGLALDISQLSSLVAFTYGLPSEGWEVPFGSVPFPASVIGGPQLARDAARTNDDVYDQAVQKCLAPARLAREFGLGDARVATSLEVLADCYMRQREYAQAEPLRREALAIWTTLFGPTDSKVARALDDHAAALRGLHRDAEASALSTRAAGIRAQLAALKAQPPANVHEPAIQPSCSSPVQAALFVRCRPAPPAHTDQPVAAARP